MSKGEDSHDANVTTGSPSLERKPSADKASKPEEGVGPGLVPPEILASMPPEVRSSFEQFLVLMRSGPSPDPLRQKVTSQHISDIILQTGEDHRRQFELEKHARYMALAVLSLVLLFVFALYILFREKPDAVQPILTHLIAFGGGIGGGMAIRTKRNPAG
jgi:hypothetical protein